MTDRTPGAPATPVAAAPGVTNPTRKSPRGILQNRERAHASQLGRPAVRRPGPRTPQNLTSRGHLKEGVCPLDLNTTETSFRRTYAVQHNMSGEEPDRKGKGRRRQRQTPRVQPDREAVEAATEEAAAAAEAAAWRERRRRASRPAPAGPSTSTAAPRRTPSPQHPSTSSAPSPPF